MITLELVKLHLRVDGEDEDDLIRLYYEAAVSDCVAYLNRPLYQDDAEVSAAAKVGKADGVVLNSSIRNAILLTVGYCILLPRRWRGWVAACRSAAVGAVSQSARRVVGFLGRLSVNRTPQNALLLYFILIRA
ncbi:head-tail connector protein [Neisseria subflava]|uniref:head-tail connector protein n=1 Tax=Neisseria subflava TaxID=28449 RepID=UPI00202AA216|nr:head-tail connector protein [Neisseria subflava]MCL9777655.1 phage gp6-like head-tail connector protein [Neisseria subflava]